MFTMVGLGLGDASDITLKGLEAVKQADVVFLEAYTSFLINSDAEKLSTVYGRPITVADREMVESGAVLAEASSRNVVLLVVGDVFGATTHSDLVVRCHQLGITYKVVHNASIINAVGCCGLQLYRFGQVLSLCFWTETWRPDSWYERLLSNRKSGVHTLLLLDIKVKEVSDENLARGRKIYEPPRYMSIHQAIEQILEVEKEHKSGAVAEDGSTFAIGVARVGSSTQQIVAGTMKELLSVDFGSPLHSLIVAGDVHECEMEHSLPPAAMSIHSKTALRQIAEFYTDTPLAFLAASPFLRSAAEHCEQGVCVSCNKYKSRTLQNRTSVYERITCVIEDPLGITLARWWLRKRSVPELTVTTTNAAAESAQYPRENVRTRRLALMKNCRLRLCSSGSSRAQASPYVLSLGELMTFGVVDQIQLHSFRLQPTNSQLAAFLRQPNGLRCISLREVGVDLNELFTLLVANVQTLSVVELIHYELATLQLFAFVTGIKELSLRDATINDAPVVFHTSESARAEADASLAGGPLLRLTPLRQLCKLDLSGVQSHLDFASLVGLVSLTSVNLSSSSVTNDDVRLISQVHTLEEVFLSHTEVDDVCNLGECKGLQVLQLSRSKVSSAGIATLGQLQKLRLLDLSHTNVDNANVLSSCQSLKTLSLWKTRVNSDGIAGLGRLQSLERLMLGDNVVKDVSCLKTCQSLRHLSLQSTLADTNGITGLELLPALETLVLAHTLVADVSHMSATAKLRNLDLTGLRMADHGLDRLGQLPCLSSIQISKTNVQSLRGLSGSKELKEVIGKRCRLANLDGVEAMPLLSTLIATHCDLTEVAALACCPELRSLNLWGSKLTQEGIDSLRECHRLVDLDLAETLITSVEPMLACECLSALVLYSSRVQSVDGLQNLRQLTRLDIANTPVVSVASLSLCSSLEVLNISDTDIDDKGFEGVEKISTLKSILLSSTKVTRIGQLGQCTALVEVFASKSALASNGICGLAGATKLEKVNISLTEVESGITSLTACMHLQKLNLKFTKAPSEDIEYLRKALPRCRIAAY